MQQADKKLLKKFGKLLINIRKSKYPSLNKFSFSKGGVTSATISRIENGLVDFKFSTLVKIACALNISLEDLFKEFNYKYEIEED